MTTHNTTSTTKYATLLMAVLLALGTASATVSTIDQASAEDIEIGQNAATFNTTFNVTASDTSEDNITLDTSSISGSYSNPSASITDGSSASITGGPQINNGNISLNITGDNSGDDVVTVEVTADADTSGVSSTSSETLNINADTGSGSASPTVNFVDTTDPSVSYEAINATEVQSGDTVKVTYDMTDDGSGIDTGSVRIEDESDNLIVEDTISGDLTSGDGQTVELTVPDSSEGVYDVNVTATDNADNTATDESTDALTVDDTNPSVSGVTVTDNNDDIVNESESVYIEATVTDSNTINSVTADASDLGAGSSVQLTTDDGSKYNKTVDSISTTVDSEGTATVTVNATDDADNFNDTQSADIDYDGVKPSIDQYSVSNPSSQDLFVTFNSSEQLADIEATVSGAESASLTEGDFSSESVGSKYNYTATYSGSTDGDYDVVLVTAQDNAENNISSTESDSTVTVNVDAPTFDSAITGGATDGNSTTEDDITLQFSDEGSSNSVNTGTVEKTDFSVEGDYSVDSVGTSGSGPTTVTLNLDDSLNTGATPNVELNGSIADDAGNTLSDVSKDAADGLKPVVTEFEAQKGSRRATVMFSEAVTDGSGNALETGDLSYTNDSGSVSSISSVSHVAGGTQATVILNAQADSDIDSDDVEFTTDVYDQASTPNQAFTISVQMSDDINQISLTKGWNLVSTPHLQADDTGELLNGVSYSSVYAYNDGDGQWETDTANMELDSMDAVYVDSDQPQEINLNRDSGAQAPPSTPVEEGWNLVGTNVDVQSGTFDLAADVAMSSVIDSNNDNKGLDTIYSPSFNPSGEWTKTDAGDFNSKNLEAFQGYWVFMDSSDELAGQTT